jgi:hypothetical protein
MVEWREWSNGGNGGKGGMEEWQKEWQNGKMAEMDTYVLFMVHADTDDTDNDDTLIFYSIDTNLYKFFCTCKIGFLYTISHGEQRNHVVKYESDCVIIGISIKI